MELLEEICDIGVVDECATTILAEEDTDSKLAKAPVGSYQTQQMGRPNRFSMASVLICEKAYKVLIG